MNCTDFLAMLIEIAAVHIGLCVKFQSKRRSQSKTNSKWHLLSDTALNYNDYRGIKNVFDF